MADLTRTYDVLVVGGGAKPTLDLLGDSVAIAFLADEKRACPDDGARVREAMMLEAGMRLE